MSGRLCTVCQHPEREEVEATLLTGESLRRIAAQFGLAPTSLRRHVDKHLSARLRAQLDDAGGIDGMTLGSALAKLGEVAADLDTIRLDAMERGDTLNAVRASTAQVRAVATVADRLGLNLDVGRELEMFGALALSVRDAVRHDPRIGELIAAGLRRRGEETAAQDVEALARPELTGGITA